MFPFSAPDPYAGLTPEQRFLVVLSEGHTDQAAAGSAGWTVIEAKAWADAHPRAYEVATNKRQLAYEKQLMATGRGTDIARVALRQETASWNVKHEGLPARSIEDYITD